MSWGPEIRAMRGASADSAIRREGSARAADAGKLGMPSPRVNRHVKSDGQNGFTITMMTMTIISSVGTSFMMRQ